MRNAARRLDMPEVNGDGAAPYYVHSESGSRVELVAHARAAGMENLPESDATEPNDVETAVIREHQRRHRDLIEQTRKELRSLTADYDRLEQGLPAPKDLQVVVEQARATAEHQLATDHALVPLRQEQQRRRRDLRGFMRDHQLTQPARYPTSRVFHLAFALVLVVIESALNMGFFAQTSSLGLVGGFIAAVGVSLTNIALGLSVGFFCFRWRNHRDPRVRRLATAGVVVYAVLVVVFNLGIAHARDEAMLFRTDHHLKLAEILRHPFSLTFSSLALFLVGVLASLIAARKGYTLDTATPGHGDVDRRFRAADESFADHRRALRDRVLGLAEAVPETCRAAVGRAEEVVEKLGQIVVTAEQCLEGYEAEREHLERWACQWLRRYRSENEAVRSTPAPSYFTEFPNFHSQVDPQPIEGFKSRLQGVGARLDELKATSRQICLDQSDRVSAARDRFEGYLGEAMGRADAGRGDGSTHPASGNGRQKAAS